MDGSLNGKPRCGRCGHSMARLGHGWECCENTCEIGLAALGDFASAERTHEREREHRAWLQLHRIR